MLSSNPICLIKPLKGGGDVEGGGDEGGGCQKGGGVMTEAEKAELELMLVSAALGSNTLNVSILPFAVVVCPEITPFLADL